MKIAVTGFALDSSGYGEAMRRVLRALQAVGAEVVPGLPCHDGQGQISPDAALIEFLTTPPVDLPDVHLMIAAADQFVSAGMHTLPAKRKAGISCWETDALHPSFAAGCAAMDILIAPSTQTMDTYRRAGLPAVCVPFPALEPPAEILPVNFGVEDSTYVFYSVMTWQDRKNPIGLLTAYFTGFTGFDDVILILKLAGGPALRQLIERQILNLLDILRLPNPPAYKLLVGDLTDDALWALHARGNCIVSLARGEAYGIPLLDALSTGNTVIASDWGGHVDFLRPRPTDPPRSGVRLVRTRLTPVAQNYHYFTGMQNWADPDILDARAHMVAAFGAGLTEKMPRDLSHLTPEAVGRQLLEVLNGD